MLVGLRWPPLETGVFAIAGSGVNNGVVVGTSIFIAGCEFNDNGGNSSIGGLKFISGGTGTDATA